MTTHVDLCPDSVPSSVVSTFTDNLTGHTAVVGVEEKIAQLSAQISVLLQHTPLDKEKVIVLFRLRSNLCEILQHNFVQIGVTSWSCTRCAIKTYHCKPSRVSSDSLASFIKRI
jgi:hypothetical protein